MGHNDPRMGVLKKKVLLLLLSGLALSLTRSGRQQIWILRQIPKEWKKIGRQALQRAINSLYTSHLVKEKNNRDGTTTLILTENGKQRALRFNIEKLEIKKQKIWDKKWRIVAFDIPEKKKRGRDALRQKLQELNFYQLQKSVFVCPYPCEKEIHFLCEFFNIGGFVNIIIADNIYNDVKLKHNFKL